MTFKTNLNSDNFQTHLTKIQTHTDIFQTHFDKNSDILQDGVKLFLIRIFLSQNVSEFWPKVSEFVWKELPQKGKKSFWGLILCLLYIHKPIKLKLNQCT